VEEVVDVNEINYFSVNIKKIEGADKDFEMIVRLNPCFSKLPKEDLDKIQDIALGSIEAIKLVLNKREVR